jgi:hypothetical protein
VKFNLQTKGTRMPTQLSSGESRSCGCQIQASIEAVKALHVMVASLMADMAALRRTVQADPDFAELYAVHLAETTRTARPLLTEALACYDEMLAMEQLPH